MILSPVSMASIGVFGLTVAAAAVSYFACNVHVASDWCCNGGLKFQSNLKFYFLYLKSGDVICDIVVAVGVDGDFDFPLCCTNCDFVAVNNLTASTKLMNCVRFPVPVSYYHRYNRLSYLQCADSTMTVSSRFESLNPSYY